jgi:hypothetical protein
MARIDRLLFIFLQLAGCGAAQDVRAENVY